MKTLTEYLTASFAYSTFVECVDRSGNDSAAKCARTLGGRCKHCNANARLRRGLVFAEVVVGC